MRVAGPYALEALATREEPHEALPPGPLHLWIEGVPTVRIDRCDAPRGCVVESMARAMPDVMIVQ